MIETDLKSLVSAQIDAWRSGGRPDAAAFLGEHPELDVDKSLALDLIYAEYRLRTQSGDTIVPSTFCEQFPAYRQSLALLLEVEEYLDQCPQFAPQPAESDWPAAGQKFMGYEIVESLGRGAFARVYVAREPALGNRLVVLKVSRFGESEAVALGKLAHDNIVPIHSVQHDSGTGWTVICMPLLGTATVVDLLAALAAGARANDDGAAIARVGNSARPLTQVSPPSDDAESKQWRGPFSDAVARLGLALAEGLEAAHAQGVVHRDIKPSNVLLGWSGRPMLLDFNLSTDEQFINRRVGGTLTYMSPEQIASLQKNRGLASRAFDPRADIYSLGAVLYELLTGDLPARPADADKLSVNAYQPWLDSKAQPPAPVRSKSPRVDSRLDAIVLKCLAVDPMERYATAAELARDLRQYQSPLPAARRFASRHRWPLLALALGTAILVASAAAYVGSQPSRHDSLLEQGLALYSRGSYDQAIGKFDECLRYKAMPQALFARGQAHRQLKHWTEARADYVALEKFDRGWAWALAGLCDLGKADFFAAMEDFRIARTAGVEDQGVQLRHAYAAAKARYFQEAANLYSGVLRASPDNYQAHRARASCYLSLMGTTDGNLPLNKLAVEDAARLCELRPDSAKARDFALQVLDAAARDPKTVARCEPQIRMCLARLLAAGCQRQALEARFHQSQELRRLVTQDLGPQNAVEGSVQSDGRAEEPTIPELPFPATANWDDFLRQVSQPARS